MQVLRRVSSTGTVTRAVGNNRRKGRCRTGSHIEMNGGVKAVPAGRVVRRFGLFGVHRHLDRRLRPNLMRITILAGIALGVISADALGGELLVKEIPLENARSALAQNSIDMMNIHGGREL